MSVEAKIASDSTSIKAAPVRTVTDTISIQPGTDIALNVPPAAVSGYSREGADLLVHLKNGETVRIADFYGDPAHASHLYLTQDDQLVATDVSTVPAGGATVDAGYAPMDALAGFETQGAAEAAVAGAGAAGGGFGSGALLPILGLVGGGGLAAAGLSGGGGSSSSPATPGSVPDTTAPAAATALAISSTGDVLTGRAEPGARVTVDVDGDGNIDYSATVDADGTFAIPLAPPLTDAQDVTVWVTDAAGNVSPPADTVAPDLTAPAAAENVTVAADGGSVSGSGEPGATASVDVDGDGAADFSVVIGADGQFTIPVSPALVNGETVTVIVTDPAGNDSGPAVATAPDLTPPPATAPTIDPTNGTVITGTAASGVAILLTDAAGNAIGQATIQADGTWSFTPATPLPDGTVISAVAINATNEPGPAATAVVDAVAPATPLIDPTNGSAITGTAEAGATVTLTDAGGQAVGQTTADATGHWSFTPATPLPDGTIVIAVASDAAGNASGPASTTVDAVAPAAPTIEPSNGSVITGTAEAGTTITLTDAGGAAVGQAIVDATGHWSFTPATPLADGTTVIAVATDAAGNASGPASTTVDAVAPATPTIDATNGTMLTGTAEAGATVTLTDGGGNPIGQVTADGTGHWSFTPATPLANATLVTAVATDAAGNASSPASTTVDTLAPATPAIDPSNGTLLTGTAEAGATITLSDGGGNPIGQTTANATGHWTFTPGTPLADGATVVAVATDAAGNASGPASTIIDAVAPATPTIDLTNGTIVTGTAEPGATVMLSDSGGNPIGQATADGTGHWTFVPATPLANGTVITAIASDAAGNASGPATTTVDSLPPAAPTIEPTDGTVLTGTAEAGATVTLTDGGGNPIGQVTADGAGNWSFTPGTPLPDATVVRAVATDATGNTGAAATAIVDTVAPAVPTIEPTNGTVLTGTAEAGATVTLTDGGGNPVGQVTADGTGNWSFTPGTPLADGTQVNAVATDAAGNTSGTATATVDAIAPATPTIDPSDGSALTGTAEAGATVVLTDGGGNPIGQTTADGAGNWTFVPGTPLADGTDVEAVARDAAGNTSGPATTTVDSVAPVAPTIEPTNGTVLTGTAEAGATVTLTDGGGNPIGQVTADGAGNWSFTPGTPLADATVVRAVATDAAGNTSHAATAVVDALAPATPTIEPTNGTVLTGTAEAGATVTLTDGGGNPIGQVTADGTGTWSFTPGTPLADGTQVNAVATDAAGNTSGTALATVDAVAPPTPTINASSGTQFTGTAEAGATVTLTDGGGNPIGQTVADGGGNWTFTPATPIPNATDVTAVAIDAAGNASGPATITVDSSLPSIPVVDPTNGTVITGTADAGATVTVYDASNAVIGTTVADGAGNWTVTPGSPLADGTVISVVATSPSLVDSAPAVATVDALAPAVPTIDATNGTILTGTAEAGATVTLTDGGGNPVGQVTADGTGAWSFTPGTPLADGTQVNAVATDAAGNTSGTATATVDAIAPATPTIDPSDGSALTGTAEAGATVVLTDGGGNPIGQTTADGAGNWTFVPGTPLADGTDVEAVARDAAGNTSGPATTTVDSVAPVAPTIEPTNGTVLTGTAEAGSTVTLTDGGGNPIGQVTADGAGNWSFTPGTPLADATVVRAVATDAAGNTSHAATAVVDALAPATPTIEPTNGTVLTGTAEAGATVTLTDGGGNPVGQVTADGTGNWSFTPGTPLPDGTQVNAVATDAAGNTSGTASATVDAIAPATPTIDPSNGSTLTGTAEAGATVVLTDGGGNPIGQTTADGAGNWTFVPGTPLANGTAIEAVARDAAGNTSGPATTTVDSVAPVAPVLSINADGTVLSGTAEAGSTVRIVVDGDTANPLTVTADVNGTFTLPLAPALASGEVISAIAIDAAGNQSGPAAIQAPDLQPVTIAVAEAADTWINGVEISDGIQTQVDLRPTMQAGQVVTVHFSGQNGYEFDTSHILTAAEIAAGQVTVTLVAPGGMGPLPEGAATVSAALDGGAGSATVDFVIDTVPPPTPVLTLVGSILTVSGEPGAVLDVDVDIGGTTAHVSVTADNSGLASLNLLTDLDIGLSWDQLLSAQVAVTGRDPAGNQSNVATLDILPSLEQPVTIGNLGVGFGLLPPTFGITGTTEPNSSLVIRVITPLINVELAPIAADSNGDFSLNLLSPTVLSQLGLTATDLLNLGADVSLNIVATDSFGNDSAAYGIDLSPNGLSLNIGQIDVNGTAGDDILSGADNSSEHINAGDGNDLILNVGAGDHVVAGDGNDTIQLTANTFVDVDGGLGFDTLLLSNGINLDYNSAGTGALHNIERVDLGTGDSGSTLTLTAAEVAAITDGNNVLQITGEGNDTLNIAGALDTGATQTIDGLVYDVYTFGTTTVLVEENTVQVVA